MQVSPDRLDAIQQQIEACLRAGPCDDGGTPLQGLGAWDVRLAVHANEAVLLGEVMLSRRLDEPLLRQACQMAIPSLRLCRGVVLMDERGNRLRLVRERLALLQSDIVLALEQLLNQMDTWDQLLMQGHVPLVKRTAVA